MSSDKTIKPLLYGHRGLSTLAPENTLPSFQLCLEHHISGIELDVHICKTGECVVVHDSNLLRVSGENYLIEKLTLQEIKQLDVGSHKNASFKGTTIPLLQEVFDLCGKNVIYDIELKPSHFNDKALCKATYKIIKDYKMEYNSSISSFSPIALKNMEEISHWTFQDAIIFSHEKHVPFFLRNGFGKHLCSCTYVKPEFSQINEKFMEKAKQDKYNVVSWVVDDLKDAKKMINFGVDGVISNNPLLLKRTGLFR